MNNVVEKNRRLKNEHGYNKAKLKKEEEEEKDRLTEREM